MISELSPDTDTTTVHSSITKNCLIIENEQWHFKSNVQNIFSTGKTTLKIGLPRKQTIYAQIRNQTMILL